MTSAKDSKTGKYSFETIASNFVVDGMFNINSVSVEAWKAILRQSRNMQVPYLAADGSTKITAAAPSFAYPRTSIAGDQGSDSRASRPRREQEILGDRTSTAELLPGSRVARRRAARGGVARQGRLILKSRKRGRITSCCFSTILPTRFSRQKSFR